MGLFVVVEWFDMYSDDGVKAMYGPYQSRDEAETAGASLKYFEVFELGTDYEGNPVTLQ